MRFVQLAVLAISLFVLAMVATAQSITHTYTVPLVSEELVFPDPSNQWSYWFELRPGMKVAGTPRLSLAYTVSPALMQASGSITVLLNGVPITSRRLPEPNAVYPRRLEVALPASLMKVGYNELRLSSRQRSIEGLCKDIDHAGNWLRFHPGSTMWLPVSTPGVTPLSLYPHPFLDRLSAAPVQSTWVLPPTSSRSNIAAMLYLASAWGSQNPLMNLPIRVTTQSPQTVPGNQVLIGEQSDWPSTMTTTVGPSSGALVMLPGTPKDPRRLLVTGGNAEGLAKAVKALAVPATMDALETSSTVVSEAPPLVLEEGSARMGSFSLADLGIRNLELKGAFHQRAVITIKRPNLANLGRHCFLDLRFRHADTLNPVRSLLTAKVNGVPMASVKLGDGNAKSGTLRVPIPVDTLHQHTWVVHLEAYHEIGAVDCGKSYDDVAWTLIEGDSQFVFTNGAVRGTPSLENFPYFITRTGGTQEPILFWLPRDPSDAELTAAARIAMRAGQENRRPLEWRVLLGDPLPMSERDKAADIVMLAQMDDARLKDLDGKLAVFPKTPRQLVVKPGLPMLPDQNYDTTVLQAITTPWAPKNGVFYGIMPANREVLGRLNQMLADRDEMAKLTGQVALVTPTARFVSYTSWTPQAIKQARAKEIHRYSWLMWLITLLGAIVLVMLLRWFIMRYIPKTKPKIAPEVATMTAAVATGVVGVEGAPMPPTPHAHREATARVEEDETFEDDDADEVAPVLVATPPSRKKVARKAAVVTPAPVEEPPASTKAVVKKADRVKASAAVVEMPAPLKPTKATPVAAKPAKAPVAAKPIKDAATKTSLVTAKPKATAAVKPVKKPPVPVEPAPVVAPVVQMPLVPAPAKARPAVGKPVGLSLLREVPVEKKADGKKVKKAKAELDKGKGKKNGKKSSK